MNPLVVLHINSYTLIAFGRLHRDIQDTTYVSSALNSIGKFAIELSVVPVHFGQGHDLVTDAGR